MDEVSCIKSSNKWIMTLNLFHCFISQDLNDGKGYIIGLKEHVSLYITVKSPSSSTTTTWNLEHYESKDIWEIAHCNFFCHKCYFNIH